MLFALVVMNVDHLLGKYHKADAASVNIPKLEERLAKATAGDDSEAPPKLRKKLAVDQKRWTRSAARSAIAGRGPPPLRDAADQYVAILLIDEILIRNLFGVPDSAGRGSASPGR